MIERRGVGLLVVYLPSLKPEVQFYLQNHLVFFLALYSRLNPVTQTHWCGGYRCSEIVGHLRRRSILQLPDPGELVVLHIVRSNLGPMESGISSSIPSLR